MSHPLQIDLILDQIFMHLDLKHLKICRQVCSKWEKTSRNLFMKKSTVCISKEERNEKDLEKFLQDFVTNSRDSIEWRFTKFSFVGEIQKDDLDAFIESRANILKGIKFKNILTPNIKGDPENWRWKWNTNHLNHFEWSGDWTGAPRVTLALSNLRTTKTIILDGDLNLNINLDQKISPSLLKVCCSVKFWTKDGLRLQNGFCLNDFFDIKNLVHLNFDFDGLHKTVDVDLSESHKLKTCTFHAGRITGWNRHLKALTCLHLDCQHFDPMAVPTSVKSLFISFYQQTDGTMDLTDFLKLEILCIRGGDAVGWHRNLVLKALTLYLFRGQVDLSLLPKSLKLLHITANPPNSVLTCSSPSTTFFPNMKALRSSYVDIVDIYRFCPSLTELSVAGGELLADVLPETLKRINIYGPVEIVGNPPTGTVDLVNVSAVLEWQLIDDILEKLNPRKITVDPFFNKTTDEMISENVFNRIRKSIEKQMKHSNGIFVLHKLQWTNSDELSVEEKEKIFMDSLLPLGLMFESFIFEDDVGALLNNSGVSRKN